MGWPSRLNSGDWIRWGERDLLRMVKRSKSRTVVAGKSGAMVWWGVGAYSAVFKPVRLLSCFANKKRK